jgi:hypothetical protein
MRKGADAVILTLLILGACSPEITTPQGGAAISRVVPVAVPDVWCPAAPEASRDTTAAKGKDRPGEACDPPERPLQAETR